MRWTELFADLEARLAAEDAAERRAEVADRTRREWATVLLADRLVGALDGGVLHLDFVGGLQLDGEAEDIGKDWILLRQANGAMAVVPLRAVVAVAGVPSTSDARPGISRRRFGFGVVMRELARDRLVVRVATTAGGAYQGVVGRVGADHFDLVPQWVEGAERVRRPRVVTVSFDHVGAVIEGR